MLCYSSEEAYFSICQIVQITSLSIFPPESKFKVDKTLLSAHGENEGLLVLLGRFTNGVNRSSCARKRAQLCPNWNSAEISFKKQCLLLGNDILDQVVQRTNAYRLSLSMNKNLKATFKTVLILQDCKTLKTLSKEAVMHVSFTLVQQLPVKLLRFLIKKIHLVINPFNTQIKIMDLK